MNKEEKKEYLNNILELILTGAEENFQLVDSLIESLNLHNDFKNYAHKEKDKLREKLIFLVERKKSLFQINKPIDFLMVDEYTKQIEELEYKKEKINDFLVFHYFKHKRESRNTEFRFKK